MVKVLGKVFTNLVVQRHYKLQQSKVGISSQTFQLDNIWVNIRIISGAEYLGCYRDSWWSRQLEKRLYSSKSNSPAKCGAHCREAGYTYFGLQANSFNPRYSQCFCGNTLGTERKRPEEECYSKCPDDPSQICGGNWRQTLYRFLSKCPHLLKTPDIVNGVTVVSILSN